MKIPLKYPISICFFLFLAQMSWSKGASTVCPKLTEPLCTDVTNKSNNDTVYVNFILRQVYAPKPDSCQSADMKTHPDTNCVDRADANYWVKLKEENKEVYASYSSMMMNVMNPSQVLPYRGDSATLIVGAVVTKMNLLVIVQDTNLIGAESYFYSAPARIVYPKINPNFGVSSERATIFSVTGQMVPAKNRAKTFTLKVLK